MRHTRSRTIVLTCAAALSGSLLLVGCTEEDDTSLRQLAPGSTAFIDPWDEDGDRGDKAQIEQLPSGEWTLDTDQPFSTKQTGDYKVEVKLIPGFVVNGKHVPAYWEVIDLNGVRVGYDHDNCQIENGDYISVPKDAKFEDGAVKPRKPKAGERSTTGDCARGGEQETSGH